MTELFTAARLFTPAAGIAPAALLVEDGRVAALGRPGDFPAPASARRRDYGSAVLVPGFVDLHVHGGAGSDFMSADAAAVAAIRRHLALHGVTSFLATTVTAPWDGLLAAVARLAAAGCDVHLEGPFLSPRQAGVHPPELLLDPSPARLDQLCDAAQGRLRWITLAPEREGALETIAAAAARGIGVALGHSDATRAQARAALAAGARHVTHTFNAMRPLHHREPGLLGEALLNASLSAEIIADGLHVDPDLVALFLRLKGPAQAVLVSDGISAAGCGDGRYRLGGIEVEVTGGECRARGRLAGSVLTLDRALAHARSFTGSSLHELLPALTENPARLLGLSRKGRLEPGADADFLVLSPEGEVQATYIGGQPLE